MMEIGGVIGGLYRTCEWITRVAFLGVLWILFTILGLVIFGLFPSTVAMLAITRKWIIGEKEISIFNTFFGVYKKEFLKSQILGIIMTGIGVILYVNILFTLTQEGFFLLKVLIVFFTIVYLITCPYLLTMFVHYELTFLEYFKNSLLIAIFNPVYSILTIVGIIPLLYLLGMFPVLFILYAVSLSGVWITWISHRIFNKIVRKKEQLGGT
ncbi:DUF624 domain-containing protein [Anaerobacillus sp. CMMVII]|uniref:YesL family protein n=1 Tax=Anaerobacillus sp. CMMVII TaxID=2755588 RepID=UPI0021B811F5|nr:DUF624 domain-containing protein [Anaerobacillus sp. CMMVII]MCT8137039.1 DUF624 domain-containing protein [Anaerobacillus sp. CMMVII]